MAVGGAGPGGLSAKPHEAACQALPESVVGDDGEALASKVAVEGEDETAALGRPDRRAF